MTSHLDKLEAKVKDLYKNHGQDAVDIIDWVYSDHVLVVANNATKLAKKYKADKELARAAALLHDIADCEMPKRNDAHEQKSLEMAKSIMRETGYDDNEIALVVDDAIRFHSCHGAERPKSIEGKILATADAQAHFGKGYYEFMTQLFAKKGESAADIRQWVQDKIDRDLNNKIQFDEEREAAKSDYLQIYNQFAV